MNLNKEKNVEAFTLDSEDNKDGKDFDKSIVHLENAGAANSQQWDQLRLDAMAAEELEHSMGLKQALRVYPKAAFWSFSISLCIVMEGYDIGLLGSIIGLPTYRQKYGHYSETAGSYQLSPSWQTAVGQASTIGCFIGIFACSWAQDRWGYRRTIQVALIALTGFIFIVFFAPNIKVLFVGQMLCGLPWGAFASSAVSYASDVTPVPLRGYLTTYVNLCWVIGQFIAAGVLQSTSTRTDQWGYRIPFAIQWLWPLPLFILVTLAPESPWYLVRKGKLEEAKQAVARLSRRGDVTDPAQTVAMMIRTNQIELANQTGSSYLDCFKGSDLRRTEIACLGWAAQILAGSSFANSPTYFFQQAGLSTANSFKLGLGTTALAFVGTCGSWITLTYFGRRTIYLSGLVVLTVLLFVVGGVSFPAQTNSNAAWGQAAAILIWVLVYDFTVGPLAYCIVGEVSSTRLRSKTVGLSRNLYNILSVVSGILNTYQINPDAWNWKGKAGFFWGASAGLITIWAYFRLPECKGRTYRELDIMFERGIPARRFKDTVVDKEAEE
ncbi:MFS transporter, SP family, general alpha glucoside:H+ symporter [Cryptococcus neoformans Tu259-1]|uniref:MFS transporter, SP family, general alpha glucoside:H+ symporter n=1 Tax=Cryptococcus neoformans Tu259-1 TaxID=1230072 RepID=A0A854Q5N3_CRYNE|nr:MFS transporter, SP family, general alpha glucoside:H+ symporter [Cryptococcus neoformans var. grubii AD1-83a]OWZ50157.1 MFS transporter, SP family, general alpha glucoside:H+ symporter [Cryptococcus neoformans var. grubii 125.91]OXG11107.1 MFS transporter, SP family, general alpha glucoside:H+ symporter [Cryptococcus neoformans var. grubii Tu259-1]OXG46354.1 MFS transporter, SP family, general alpha glucoside:H+ symporter [Cryptococcus neoformans var. grubii MW-RSA1955]OXG49704.1 MFS transp